LEKFTDIPALSVNGFTATPRGLLIDPAISFDQWEAYGWGLQHVKKALHWCIGDWLNFGAERWPDRYAQAVGVTGLAEGTLRNYSYVARRVEPGNRRENVGFDVHFAVAPLEVEQQNKWLDKAESEGMTRQQIRSAISEGNGVSVIDGLFARIIRALDNAIQYAEGEDVDRLRMAQSILRDRT